MGNDAVLYIITTLVGVRHRSDHNRRHHYGHYTMQNNTALHTKQQNR